MDTNYSFVNHTFFSSFHHYYISDHESGGYLIEPRDRVRRSVDTWLKGYLHFIIFLDPSNSNHSENLLRDTKLRLQGHTVHSYTSNEYIRFFKKINGFLHDTIAERFYNSIENAIHQRGIDTLRTFLNPIDNGIKTCINCHKYCPWEKQIGLQPTYKIYEPRIWCYLKGVKPDSEPCENFQFRTRRIGPLRVTHTETDTGVNGKKQSNRKEILEWVTYNSAKNFISYESDVKIGKHGKYKVDFIIHKRVAVLLDREMKSTKKLERAFRRHLGVKKITVLQLKSASSGIKDWFRYKEIIRSLCTEQGRVGDNKIQIKPYNKCSNCQIEHRDHRYIVKRNKRVKNKNKFKIKGKITIETLNTGIGYCCKCAKKLGITKKKQFDEYKKNYLSTSRTSSRYKNQLFIHPLKKFSRAQGTKETEDLIKRKRQEKRQKLLIQQKKLEQTKIISTLNCMSLVTQNPDTVGAVWLSTIIFIGLSRFGSNTSSTSSSSRVSRWRKDAKPSQAQNTSSHTDSAASGIINNTGHSWSAKTSGEPFRSFVVRKLLYPKYAWKSYHQLGSSR